MNVYFLRGRLRAGVLSAVLCVVCIAGLVAVLAGPVAADDETAAGSEPDGAGADEPTADEPAVDAATRTLTVFVDAGEDASVEEWTVYIMSADGSAVHASGPGEATHTANNGETYRLAQDAPEGFAFDELICTSGSEDVALMTGPSADGTATVTIPLEGGDDVVCRFVNMKAAVLASGMLTIAMTADGADGQAFGFTIVDAASGGIVDGYLVANEETVGPVPLVPGTYHLLQTKTPLGVPGSWNLADVTCSDDASAWNPPVDANMPDHWWLGVDIADGADVTCSFHVAAIHQPQTGRVVVVKHEIGDLSGHRPWEFNLRSATGEAAFAHNKVSPVSLLVAHLDQQRQLDGAGQLSFQEVEPGQYSVREVNGSGQRCYLGSDFETLWGFSDDIATAMYGNESGTFSIGAGERVEVHFFNRRCNHNGPNGGTLVIGKVNIGGSPLTNFNVSVAGVDGDFSISGVKPATLSGLAAGDYVVSEAPADGHTTLGWSLVKGGESCPMEPQHSGSTATVTVGNGAPAVLCFYNEVAAVSPGGPDDDDSGAGEPVTPLPPSTGTGNTALGSTGVLTVIVLGTAIGLTAGAAADVVGRRRKMRASLASSAASV